MPRSLGAAAAGQGPSAHGGTYMGIPGPGGVTDGGWHPESNQ